MTPNLYDVNTFWGNWPFQRVGFSSCDELDSHFRKQLIQKCLISPIGSILNDEPYSYNEELFEIATDNTLLNVIPVINPRLQNWEKKLIRYIEVHRTNAVKIHPNYHGYSLQNRRFLKLVNFLQENKVKLVIQMRVEDERTRYFGLKIKGVPIDTMIKFGMKFSHFPVLCLGAYLPEIREIAQHTVAIHIDTSFAEWHDTMKLLLQTMPVERVHFGSNSPLFYTKANIDKLILGSATPKQIENIAFQNTEKFLQ